MHVLKKPSKIFKRSLRISRPIGALLLLAFMGFSYFASMSIAVAQTNSIGAASGVNLIPENVGLINPTAGRPAWTGTYETPTAPTLVGPPAGSTGRGPTNGPHGGFVPPTGSALVPPSGTGGLPIGPPVDSDQGLPIGPPVDSDQGLTVGPPVDSNQGLSIGAPPGAEAPIDPVTQISPGISGTDDSSKSENATRYYNQGYSSLISEAVEQNEHSYGYLDALLNLDSPGVYNDVYNGIQAFFDRTIGLGWLPNLGQLIAKWITEFIQGWMAPLGEFMVYWMIQFAYNPDVSVGTDGFSTQVRGMARGVRDLANDLLLLFFILSIWRYWSSAAGGRGTIMGAVGRIIVAAAVMIAWPTIYHYVIQIANSSISLFLPTDSHYAEEVGRAVFNAFWKALTVGAVSAYLPTDSTFLGVIGAIGGLLIVTFLQIILVLAIGVAMLVALVGFFAMRVVQLVLIVAAYPFAPFFLCLLVSPDTESYASGFIRSFVEATLWTFIWAGFMRLMVILLNYA